MSLPEDFFQQTIDQELYDEVTVKKVPPTGNYTAVVKKLRWGTFNERHYQHPGGSKVAVTMRLYNKDFEDVGEVVADATPLEVRTKAGRLGLASVLFQRIVEAAHLKSGATLGDFTMEGEGSIINIWGKEQVRVMIGNMPELVREALLDQGFVDTDFRYVDITEDNREWFKEQGIEATFGILAARPAKPSEITPFTEARREPESLVDDLPF